MNLTFEWVVSILGSAVVAAFWRWADKLGKNDDEITKKLELMLKQIHEVELSYQSKDEAKRERSEVMDLLREIKSSLKEVSDKLDKKVDK
ncbi:hypothetical protein QEO94_11240 [Kingella negevensis]|uniref:hypothetical protein n=1 Tax=Kingella negevensis TaxID=1522312 RepID=UPI002542B42E|nr:hypothetical protein [Kingella negevensis]WII93173.1 hypothetical protein QEO94_11240 [Kingella negevensis]